MGELTPYSKQTISVSQSVIDINKVGFYNALRTFGVVEKKDAAWFNNKNGGFYVTQKGHNYYKEEIEAAKILAQNGYQVIMQPEGDGSGGVSLKLSEVGKSTYPEGTIGSLWYEQHTSLTSGQNTVFEGLKHAHKKGVELALIFNKGGRISNLDMTNGIAHYNRQHFNTPRTIFKEILFITKRRGEKKWVIEKWHL